MAVVEVPKVKVEKLGLKPFHDFDEANQTWPRGDRPAAIREAAAEFRSRFATPENRVRGIRTVDIASAGYPLKFAFGGAAKAPNPFINIINRLQVVQFEDFNGDLKTLAYEPTVPEGPAEAPYYAQQIEKLGEFLSYKVLATIWNHPDEALVKIGLRPEDVDYVSFDHLHVQDLRFVLGTTEPIPGEPAPRPPLFPNARSGTRSPRSIPCSGPGTSRTGSRTSSPTTSCWSTATSSWARESRSSGRPDTPMATTRCASIPRTGCGSPPRTVSPPTPGTRTCRRSRVSSAPRSSSGAR